MSPRLLRPLATGFDPRSIANIGAWFDASDLSTLSQTSDGTTPVTANDNPVAYWKCKATGTALTQSTDANRPLWKSASVIGSNPGLEFDGSNDYLFATSGDLMKVARNVPGVTVFAVLRVDNTTTRAIWTAGIGAGVNQFRGRVNFTSGTNFSAGGRRLDADTFVTASSSIVTVTGNNHILRQTNDYANSDVFLHVNGTLRGSSTSFQTDGNSEDTDSSHLMLGGSFNSDAFTATGGLHDGIMCEWIAYSRALTAAESARVERYLSGKYGITVA
jgi:hypothetical protein